MPEETFGVDRRLAFIFETETAVTCQAHLKSLMVRIAAMARGTPGQATLTSPIPAGPRPLFTDPQTTPTPRFREGSTILIIH